MTEEVECRRSFRLKDKPAREYAFRDYLRKKDWLPQEIVEMNKKYDDLFSSVVMNAFSIDVKEMTPEEYLAEKRAMEPPSPPPKKPRGPRGPYKKRPKPLEEGEVDDIVILHSELIEIKNRIKKVKGSPKRKRKPSDNAIKSIEEKLEKVEKLVEKMERKDNKSSVKKQRTDSRLSSSNIEIVSVTAFECSCGVTFDNHAECHRHLFEKHTDSEEQNCVECGNGLDEIRTNHICHVCNKFAENLELHLVSHYRDCNSRTAIMECRFCTKQFKTVKEVMAHEQDKHLQKQVRRIVNVYKCNECSTTFPYAELLTCHYSNHVDTSALWDIVDELQGKIDAEKEECPFCRINMSSRKSFRAHLLKSHWIACKSLSRISLSEQIQTDQKIKQEINEMTRDVETDILMKEVKQEVKEEIPDDEYPTC
uniref:C2H2-type domain-containing protein n=1 Tax=Caenorhabditis tropicalis TaxID=1561998 RepID=A0A1I7TWS1_9PELO